MGPGAVIVHIFGPVPDILPRAAAFEQEILSAGGREHYAARIARYGLQGAVALRVQHLWLRPAEHPALQNIKSRRGAAGVVVAADIHQGEVGGAGGISEGFCAGVIEVGKPQRVAEFVAERADLGKAHRLSVFLEAELRTAGVTRQLDAVQLYGVEVIAVRPDALRIGAVGLLTAGIIDENVIPSPVLRVLGEIYVGICQGGRLAGHFRCLGVAVCGVVGPLVGEGVGAGDGELGVKAEVGVVVIILPGAACGTAAGVAAPVHKIVERLGGAAVAEGDVGKCNQNHQRFLMPDGLHRGAGQKRREELFARDAPGGGLHIGLHLHLVRRGGGTQIPAKQGPLLF